MFRRFAPRQRVRGFQKRQRRQFGGRRLGGPGGRGGDICSGAVGEALTGGWEPWRLDLPSELAQDEALEVVEE